MAMVVFDSNVQCSPHTADADFAETVAATSQLLQTASLTWSRLVKTSASKLWHAVCLFNRSKQSSKSASNSGLDTAARGLRPAAPACLRQEADHLASEPTWSYSEFDIVVGT